MRTKIIASFLILCMLAIPGCGAKTDFNNEIEIQIPGLDDEYQYAILNDIHLFIADDELKPENEALVLARINEFSLDGKTSASNFELWVSNLDSKNIDGLILNADIVDQLSAVNLEHVSKVLKNTKVPFMYLQSDHDLATDWTAPDEEDYERIHIIQNEMNFNQGFYTFEEDAFIILGINYSWMSMSEDTLNGIKAEFAKGKPIIIVTHVPYDSVASDDLRELSKSLKNDRVLLWGTREDNYYYPNPYMMEYLNMVMADDSPVVAVVAAHLHDDFKTKLTDKIDEYVTGTGYSGVRTKLKIVPTR